MYVRGLLRILYDVCQGFITNSVRCVSGFYYGFCTMYVRVFITDSVQCTSGFYYGFCMMYVRILLRILYDVHQGFNTTSVRCTSGFHNGSHTMHVMDSSSILHADNLCNKGKSLSSQYFKCVGRKDSNLTYPICFWLTCLKMTLNKCICIYNITMVIRINYRKCEDNMLKINFCCLATDIIMFLRICYFMIR